MPESKNKKPRLGFVAKSIGQASEAWLYRQLVNIEEFQPFALTWSYVNQKSHPLGEIDWRELPFKSDEDRGLFEKLRNRIRVTQYGLKFNYVKLCIMDIEEWIDQTRPGVILCQYGPIALITLSAVHRRGIPVVPHFHGFDLSSYFERKTYRRSLIRNLSHFKKMVVVGEHQVEILERHGVDRSRIHKIPCGVPTNNFRFIERDHSPPVRFLSVCRLVEKKGLKYTFEAFAKASAKVEDIQLDVLGDGPLFEELRKLASDLDISERVKFEGAVPQERVKEAMENSDIFVQHSIASSSAGSEGFPIGTAEAASTGLPVVATISPGLVEQVVDGETGFLVPQRDVQSMADRMIELAIDKDLRTRMGSAGRKRMVENFDTQMQVRKLEDVLISCLS